MQINGYQLREALRRWTTRMQISAKIFPESIFAFEGEGDNPEKLDNDFWSASRNVAIVQKAQHDYNGKVIVKFSGGEISLSEAIKLLAFASQRCKMWRTAAEQQVSVRPFGGSNTVRSKSDEIAKRQVSVAKCMEKTEEVDRFYSSLRGAIAAANATVVELDIDEAIFS